MTETELANIALGHLGARPVVTIHEAAPEAEHIKRMWGLCRDALLRQRHWNFALRTAALSATAEKPHGWARAWQTPADYLLAVELNGRAAGTGAAGFTVEGGKVLSDDETAALRYVARVEAVSLWDASFCEAFSYRLAAMVCPALSQAQGMAERMLAMSEQILQRAYGPDNLESRPRAIPAQSGNGWLRARTGGGAW